MPIRRRVRYLLVQAFLFSMAVATSWGQSQAPLVLLKQQALSIAAEAVAKIDSTTTPSVAQLVVNGGSEKAIVENAFVQVLQDAGWDVRLNSTDTPEALFVKVLILENGIRYDTTRGTPVVRTATMAVDVRTSGGRNRQTRLVGSFHRSSVDTVLASEANEWQRGVVNTAEESTIDKLLLPLIAIGGAILIVYLFYTVRS